MSLPSAVIDAMLAAGCSAEQLAAAVKAANTEAEAKALEAEAKAAERRARDAERKRMSRNVQRTSMDIHGQERIPADTPDTLSSPEGSSPTPPSPKPHLSHTPSPPKGGSVPTGFPEFWSRYPNKVGKADAQRKFEAALKVAPFEDIMAGLERYVAKTDDRPWCNPATWLHQQRWADEPAMSPLPRGSPASPKPMNARDLSQALLREMEANDEHSQAHSSRRQPALVALPGRQSGGW